MADELNADLKLEIYKLVLKKYKDLISEKEARSITEIRQRVSPYNEFIKKLKDRFLQDMAPYYYKNHFMTATQRAIDYVRSIKTCEFSFTFWVEFKEMDELKIGTAMDKAIFLAAIIRSFESENVRVLVTKSGKPMVRFNWNDTSYLFLADSGSLLVGDDATQLLSNDPIGYSFNDLIYESYEDQ